MYAGANQGGREMEVMNGNRVLNKKAVPSFFNMEEILNENMMLGKSIQKNSHFEEDRKSTRPPVTNKSRMPSSA